MIEHRKTRRSFNTPGDAHSLTFSCFQRQPFLTRDRSRQWFVDSVNRARELHLFHVWAYVIMPEHIHLMIWPTKPVYDISAILFSIKRSVTSKAVSFLEQNAPNFLDRMADRQPNGKVHYRFWQRGGGYDFNVVEPATTYRQIDYFHNNPVRRGLCSKPEEWHWSSATDYAGIRIGPIEIDRESLPLYVAR